MNALPAEMNTHDLPECGPDPADNITDDEMLEKVQSGDWIDYFTDGDGADVAANWCEASDHHQIPTEIMRGFKRWYRERRLSARMADRVDAA